MKTLSLLGLQWGDEGKGKIIDHLAAEYDITVRFQGGGNAGHTVIVGEQKHVLHHIPSGILHDGKTALIGDGTVLDLDTLFEEIAQLKDAGISVEGRLFIGNGTHLVLPYHKILDGATEAKLGDGKIGTTGRGIGPCYADRRARVGIRFRDLFDAAKLEDRLHRALLEKNCLFTQLYDLEAVDAKALAGRLLDQGSQLKDMGVDTADYLTDAMDQGRSVLFEGAQGTLLDLDWGTYPFVTSSTTSISAVPLGTGLSPKCIGTVLGVIKAYTTRVGAGPFPTEDTGEMGTHLRDKGNEYGATTGRPRRCGWLDGVAGRYAVRLNGVDQLVVTKLDVLSGLQEVNVAVSYGNPPGFSPDLDRLAQAVPQYETFEGWQEDLSEARSMKDLPPACHTYLEGIERIVGAPVHMISVGPERRQIFTRDSHEK